VLVSIPVVALAGAEAAEVVTAIATTLALRVPALAGGGPVLLAAALLGLPFLVQSVVAWLKIWETKLSVSWFDMWWVIDMPRFEFESRIFQ
jgi:hypothetical protein